MPELPWEEVPGNPEESIRLNTARYTKVLEEAVRRDEEMASGKVKPIPMDEVFAELRATRG